MPKISEIQKMSIEKLEELVRNSEFDSRSRELATAELNIRLLKSLKKPHWTVHPNFWVSLIAAIAACVVVALQFIHLNP